MTSQHQKKHVNMRKRAQSVSHIAPENNAIWKIAEDIPLTNSDSIIVSNANFGSYRIPKRGLMPRGRSQPLQKTPSSIRETSVVPVSTSRSQQDLSSEVDMRAPSTPAPVKAFHSLAPAPNKGILKKISCYSSQQPRAATVMSSDGDSDDEGLPKYVVPNFENIKAAENTKNVCPKVKRIPKKQQMPLATAATVLKRALLKNLPPFKIKAKTTPKAVPNLFVLCEKAILREDHDLFDVHVPFRILNPALEHLSMDMLFHAEITMPWLEAGIESIWRKRLALDFPTARLFPLESYGETYRRCMVEAEDPFSALKL